MTGGEGVGRVTKPGLDVAPGNPGTDGPASNVAIPVSSLSDLADFAGFQHVYGG